MSTDASDQDEATGAGRDPRRAVLTVLAVLALLVAGFVGGSLAIDPEGPDFQEMFFAAGLGMVALAVAGLALVFRDLTVARRLEDDQVPADRRAGEGVQGRRWVEPAVPPIVALEPRVSTGEPGRVEREEARPRPRIKDEFYDVTVLDGVDVEASKALGEHGIEDTWDLREVEDEEIAEAANVPIEVAVRWRSMAELVAASGLGPAHAALLTRCGIGSLEELADADPGTLADRIDHVWADGTIRKPGQRLDAEEIEPWIQAAREHLAEPEPEALAA